MTRFVPASAFALAGSLLLSYAAAVQAFDRGGVAPNPPQSRLDGLIARGGGGGGFRGGGGGGGGGFRGGGGGGGGFRSGGGGGDGFRGAARPQTGFQSAGSGFNRGSNRPVGGWANSVGPDRSRPAALDRPATRPANGDRLGNRNGNFNGNLNVDRTVNRNVNRNLNVNGNVGRDWGRNVNIGNVNLQPGWARPGWGVARPWNYGWYGGWATPSWGWWGAQAALWGVGSLASAAIINQAVDSAISNQTTYIVVPNTDYQLLYGTVMPSGSTGVSFDVTAAGNTYQLSADCEAGTLNGRTPASAAEAELLNAACQVAFGST